MPKRERKTVLNGDCREFVVRLRKYFEREKLNGGPLLPLTQVCDRVADALGIGRATVVRINKEKFGKRPNEVEEEGERKLSTPNQNRKKASPVTDIDDADAAAIRHHINTYYTGELNNGQFPSLKKLSASLKEAELFKGSLPSLSKVLKKIGFGHKKRNKMKIKKYL